MVGPNTSHKTGLHGCHNQDPTKDRWGIEKALIVGSQQGL